MPSFTFHAPAVLCLVSQMDDIFEMPIEYSPQGLKGHWRRALTPQESVAEGGKNMELMVIWTERECSDEGGVLSFDTDAAGHFGRVAKRSSSRRRIEGGILLKKNGRVQ